MFAIVACLIAAAASLMRGGRYHHGDEAPRNRACGAGATGDPDPHIPTRGAACKLSGMDNRRSV